MASALRIPEPVVTAAVDTLLTALVAPAVVRSIRRAHPAWALLVVIAAAVALVLVG